MNGWMDERMDGAMEEWMDQQMKLICIYESIYACHPYEQSLDFFDKRQTLSRASCHGLLLTKSVRGQRGDRLIELIQLLPYRK